MKERGKLRVGKVGICAGVIGVSLPRRSDQPLPGGGPGLVSSARVGAGLLPADGRHRGELASEHQVPAARLLHLRPHLRLRGQGGLTGTTDQRVEEIRCVVCD